MEQGDAHDGQGRPPEVRRVRRSRPAPGPLRDRRFLIAAGLVAAAVLATGAVVAARGGDATPAALTEVRSEVTTAPTTPPSSTTPPVPDGPVAPLTGVQLFADRAALLDRPALVAKVDNDPRAMPQRSLELADVVIELQVEGISRFMAVFHSQDVAEVSPIRSARTSDPDLLAMFGTPLFAWSGGNPTTAALVMDLPWVHNIGADSHDRLYSRSSERRAPHNLVLDATAAFDTAEPGDPVPLPIFGHLAPGQDAGGSPVPGFQVVVGGSRAGYAWSEERGGWLRWTNDVVHTDPGGTQLAPTNVVVLETEYVDSSADARSPEAVTLGSGRAWVFTAGRAIDATWSRQDRTHPWTLLDAAGAPVLLSPGSTWVELPGTGDVPQLLPAA